MVEILDGRTNYFWFPVGEHEELGMLSGSPEAAYMCTAENTSLMTHLQPIFKMSSPGMTPLIEQNVFVLGSRNPPLLSHHGIVMI